MVIVASTKTLKRLKNKSIKRIYLIAYNKMVNSARMTPLAPKKVMYAC